MTNPQSAIRNPQSEDYEWLIALAQGARQYSYAPYSQFRVGAALLAESGRVYTGCNIENAAYSPTICAERVALGAAIAAGEPVGKFPMIAVVGGLAKPTTPCGVCRQVLSELAHGAIVVMASDPEKGDGRLVLTVEELLPHGFESYKEEKESDEGNRDSSKYPKVQQIIPERQMKNIFEVGRTYNRQEDIHAKYGGQAQGGISTPSGHPFIFLFVADIGSEFGYKDGWSNDGTFLYTGEGQSGDMEFVRGNRAIRDHEQEGKELHLFKSMGKGVGYEYIGRFACRSWEYREGIDTRNQQRRVIVFHLAEQA